MRALAFAIAFTAIGAQANYDAWTSREEVWKASQAMAARLATFQQDLTTVSPSARLSQQWTTVQQQVAALEALVKTGAAYEESLIQFKSLGSALSEARRLMYEEELCYAPSLASSYQALRLAFRRLDRNMAGHPCRE